MTHRQRQRSARCRRNVTARWRWTLDPADTGEATTDRKSSKSRPANLYHDFASGERDDRPGLDSCVRALRKGDVLVVLKLDRLGRSRSHGAAARPDRATTRKRQQRRPHPISASDSTNRTRSAGIRTDPRPTQESGGRRSHQIMPDALRFPVLIVAGFGASPVWNAPGQPPCCEARDMRPGGLTLSLWTKHKPSRRRKTD